MFVIVILCMMLTACVDDKDYTYGFCGQGMECYYDYIDGEDTCYFCFKALRN